MQNRRKKIKIVVAGDETVGKTSFIASLISDASMKRVEKIIGPVVLPPDMFNWHYDCTTVLIDTSSDIQDIELVEQEVRQADVVLLMYDVSNLASSERLGVYWMPRIQKVSPKVPVVVVGNKIDLLEDEKLQDEIEFQRIFKVIKPLIRHYNQVEMGMECSVLQGKNISDIIHCAQRAYLFPLGPLYNLSEKQLTPAFKRALARIFRICDKDQDGRWNDKELMAFQQRVFKRELEKSDIVGIKEMIKEELQNSTNDQGITFEGFLALQKRGVELIKIQTCWTILRHFKYQDDLQLDQNLFNNELLVDKDAGQSVELSSKAIEYFKSIFKQFTFPQPFMPLEKIQEIFYPSPIQPWNNFEEMTKTRAFNGQPSVDLEHWIGLWNLQTYLDYMETYRLMKYIGYEGALHEAFMIMNKKNSYSEFTKISQRNVFHIVLITSYENQNNQQNRILESLIEYEGQIQNKQGYVVTHFSLQPQKWKYIIFSQIARKDINNYLQNKLLSDIDFFAISEYDYQIQVPFPVIRFQVMEIPQESIVSCNEFVDLNDLKKQVNLALEKPFKFLDSQIINELKSQESFFSRSSLQVMLLAGILTTSLFFYKQIQRRK